MKKLLTIGVLCAALFGAYIMTSCETEPPLAIEYAVDVTIGQGGSVATEVEGETASKAFEGESVTLTATPDEDYEFDKWTVESGGVELSDNPATFSMPAADVSVKAEFREKDKTPYAIKVIAGENGQATATVDDKPVTEAPQGTEITLTAKPEKEYLLLEWTTENEDVVFADAEATVTTFIMPASEVEIAAEFIFDEEVLVKRPIVLTNDGNGTAVAMIDGVEVTEASRGTEITIISIPADGYAFDKWTPVSNGVELDNPKAYKTKFTMPTADVEIAVEFVPENEVDVLTKCTDEAFRAVCEYFMENKYTYNHKWDGQLSHLAWDTDSDGRLSIQEAEAVTIIMQPNTTIPYISSLEGIEYFKNLEILSCGYNILKKLDLSSNTALRDLYCSNNQLEELDLSNNKRLRILYCNYNQLKKLDLTANTELYHAVECNNNLLESIDVSGCTKLLYLDCLNNSIESLDVSTNTALWTLMCCGNRLSSLNIENMATYDGSGIYEGEEYTDLYTIWCGLQRSNDTTPQLLTITMREDQKPWWYYNAAIPQDENGASPNMYTIVKGDPVDVLEKIPDPVFKTYCKGLDLVKDGVLSMAEAKRAKTLNLPGGIGSLEGMQYFTEVASLLCYEKNTISSLDLSGRKKLTRLLWMSNQLKSLDISGCTSLYELIVFGNQLKTLDASFMAVPADGIWTSNYIICGQQTSDGSTPQTITLNLTDTQKQHWHSSLADSDFNTNVILEGEGAEFNIFNIIKDSAFRAYCQQFDADHNMVLTKDEARAVNVINIANLGIEKLDGIEYFTEINVLNCPGNQLTTLNVSQNTKLKNIIASSNRLNSLDISKCSDLMTLIVFDNRMKELNASSMANPMGFTLMCGRQTSDGVIAQTLTLTISNEQKERWNNIMTAVENWNVILAGEGVNIFDKIPDLNFKAFCQRYDTDKDGVLTLQEARMVKTINTGYDSSITSLEGIQYFTELTTLKCSGSSDDGIYSNLTTLDLRNNTKLTNVVCNYGKLDYIDIRGCTQITYLSVNNNRLTVLNASEMANPNTYHLLCGNQTSDGSTPQTLTLTLREEQKQHWTQLLPGSGYVDNTNVVLAD